MSFLNPLPKQNAAPSNLGAVLEQVVQAFSAMANATPVMVGSAYEQEFGAGSGPRVLLVPEVEGGKLGPPHEMGNVAGMTHSCRVLVRSGETQDDVTRFAEAYALLDVVVECVQTAGTGRVVWGVLVDDSPVKVPSGFGAGLKTSFTFTRDVRHGARARLAAAGLTAAPVFQLVPDNREGEGAEPGTTGTLTDLTTTVTPQEE